MFDVSKAALHLNCHEYDDTLVISSQKEKKNLNKRMNVVTMDVIMSACC